MSSIKMLLDKLHVLAFGLGDSHLYEFESTKSREDSREEEDTPAVAVARKREVLELKKLLIKKTVGCPVIQKEPWNALTRFLFSSKLPTVEHIGQSTRGKKTLHDPLLPTRVPYDMSICTELKKSHRTEVEARHVCEILSNASREAVIRLADVRSRNSDAHVVVVPDHDGHQVSWASDSTVFNTRISGLHLEALRTLYSTHSQDDADQQHFNRRLFCLLMRYDAVGGPMYQCSITEKTFEVLRSQFGVAKECFASPFNHNADVYWSAFPDTDVFFGSQGSFFTSLQSPLVMEGGSFYANPPFVEEYMRLLRDYMEKILTMPVPVSFAVMIPTWNNEPSHIWMCQNKFLKYDLRLEPNEYGYVDGNQQVNTGTVKPIHVARFKSSFFILQNDQGSEKWPVHDINKQSLIRSFDLNE